MPLRGKLEGKTMCIECEQKHEQQLANERLIEESRKRNIVRKVADEHPELRAKIMQRLGIKDFAASYLVKDHDFQDICGWDHLISQAKNYETAKRYEDSAKTYESLGLWKEAGTVRDKKSARTVKHVTVNINDLIEKVRDGGLTIPYKCHSCGATITIDSSSNPDGLKFCSYCGSAVDPDSMLDIIKSALK
jgi:DNA-directed RNA polymerase subunit RPC12/RpoP